MVQEGRGHAAIDVWAIGKPLCSRYLSFAEREEIALLRVQGYSMQEVARRLGRVASTISRELRRKRRHPKRRPRVSCDDSAMARRERAARRPKQAKLARAAALRTYVEERLAGIVVAPSGAPVPGPVVSWKSRRHGPRKDRRWANAWSRSRSPSPADGLRGRRDHAHQP